VVWEVANATRSKAIQRCVGRGSERLRSSRCNSRPSYSGNASTVPLNDGSAERAFRYRDNALMPFVPGSGRWYDPAPDPVCQLSFRAAVARDGKHHSHHLLFRSL
jgi:hypothetical protein